MNHLDRARAHRGFSILEIVIGAILGGLLLAITWRGLDQLGRQSASSSEELSRTGDALQFIETVRSELASMVINPLEEAQDHEGNSFLISRPNGTSIQFVMERRTDDRRERFLVYYEARNPTDLGDGGALILRKRVWRFNQMTPWVDRIAFPQGWPPGWIGELVLDDTRSFQQLYVQDVRWQVQVPAENEGQIFFRLKLVMRAPGSTRCVPMTTLVAVSTPDLPADVPDCPCLFAPGFDPAHPDCNFCTTGGTP